MIIVKGPYVFRVPKNAWLKGQDINAEIAGEVTINKKPGGMFLLSGPLNTLRGNYHFMGKIFRLTRGDVEFLGLREVNPNLNIEAQTQIRSVTIIVTLHGTAREIVIDLSSDPAMEESDIISYLVFGRSSDNLSGDQAFNVAATAVLFLFFFAWLGADWATRFQYLVMVILAAALVSFFIGGIPDWHSEVLLQNWQTPSSGSGFWVIFAIFFPAVTGFTQGVSMSGDLKDPSKSLPLGTFLAVGLSIIVYIGVAVVFAGVLPNHIMAGTYDSMRQVAKWGFLVDAGVIAATLSSAMASFLGAPRILQSLAGDRIFIFLMPFAKGHGPTNNPRRGVLLAGGIAFITVMLGRLNLIAPLVSMFFLISYGLLNYATFYEARSASPAFRPRFKWFDKRLSFIGFLTCLGVMLAIDPRAGIIAVTILMAVYQYLKRTAGPARWADGSRAYHLQRIRENLLAAAEDPQHPRDWRPMILALTNDRDRRPHLFSFAEWIEGGSGLTSAVRFMEGDGASLRKQKEAAEKELSADVLSGDKKLFPLVIGAPDIMDALPIAMQSYGIGPLKANMLLINWFGQLGTGITGIGAVQYVNTLRYAFRQGLNLVILNSDAEQWQRMIGYRRPYSDGLRRVGGKRKEGGTGRRGRANGKEKCNRTDECPAE